MSGALKLLLALLLPSTLLTTCCVVGAGLSLIGRWFRPVLGLGRVLLSVGVIGFAAILVLPLDQWLLRPLEDRFPPPSPLSHVDGVVVLGGAISAAVTADRGVPILNGDGDRLVAFAALARTFPAARLVFAGGPASFGTTGLTEAEASGALLGTLGIAPGRVAYDDKSRTTRENALNALALAHPGENEIWVLVTSASHMPRAMGAFRGAGWPRITAWPVAYRTTRSGWPSPLQPVAAKLAAVDLAAHEWVGLAGYRIEGRTPDLLPGP